MRSKEVKEAIELLHNEILSIKEGLEKGWYYGERYNLEQEIKKKETLLNYISELEEENLTQRSQINSAFDNGFIHKDKIRDKIKELEELNFNNYANEYDNGNEVKYYILKEFKEIIGE